MDIKKYQGQLDNLRVLSQKSKKPMSLDRTRKEILDEFKEEALKEVFLKNHPACDEIFRWAQAHRPYSGLASIFYMLKDVADLIEKVEKITKKGCGMGPEDC